MQLAVTVLNSSLLRPVWSLVLRRAVVDAHDLSHIQINPEWTSLETDVKPNQLKQMLKIKIDEKARFCEKRNNCETKSSSKHTHLTRLDIALHGAFNIHIE